jgi:hypothetical protein
MGAEQGEQARIIPQPMPITLVGIFEGEEGLLISRDDTGAMRLPSCEILRPSHGGEAQKQIDAEHHYLKRSVFEKCGLTLEVETVIGYYLLRDPVSEKSNLYKTFLMKPSPAFVARSWKRHSHFDGEFIPADLKLILGYYPDLSSADKHILIEYFDWLPKQAETTALRLLKSL